MFIPVTVEHLRLWSVGKAFAAIVLLSSYPNLQWDLFLNLDVSAISLGPCTVVNTRCTCENRPVIFVCPCFSVLDVMGHSSLSASTVLCSEALETFLVL